MTRLRLGVIGLGLIAQVAHLPNLIRLSRSFAITHVCDISPTLLGEVAAGLPGAPRTSLDWRAVLDDPEVDGVLLLTPGAHAALAAASLAARKHVLAEKPLCLTQAEAVALERSAVAQDRVLQVAYMKAYDPAIGPAREAIERTGPVRSVSIEVRHPSHVSQIGHLDIIPATDADARVLQAAEAEAREATRQALGDAPPGIADLYRDVLQGSVVHELSAIRALGIDVPAVWEHVEAWPFDAWAAGADPPSLAATARAGDGIRVRLQWLWLPDYPRYEETISIVGSRGAVHLDMPQPYGPNVSAVLRVRGPDGSETQVLDGRQRRTSGFLEELRAFHAAVTGDGPVHAGAAEAREDTASLEALAASLAAGHGIALGGEAARLGKGAGS